MSYNLAREDWGTKGEELERLSAEDLLRWALETFEPYFDPEFNCADVFMLLNVPDLSPRYARRFLGKETTAGVALA